MNKSEETKKHWSVYLLYNGDGCIKTVRIFLLCICLKIICKKKTNVCPGYRAYNVL